MTITSFLFSESNSSRLVFFKRRVVFSISGRPFGSVLDSVLVSSNLL